MGKTIRRWERRKMPVQDRSRATIGYVLEAAAQLFGELGYEGTTTNRVAERAGVSIGSVYQYFPNKEALLLALAERHLEEARERATATLRHLRERRLTPEEFFRGFVEFVVDFHRGGESLHRLFFEEAPRSRRLLELVGAINAACASEIEDYLHGVGSGGDDLALKSMVLANMVGMLAHDELLDPPPGHTSDSGLHDV
jgi:AcrR family transcriptional regulator